MHSNGKLCKIKLNLWQGWRKASKKAHQMTLTCSKLTIETLELGVKYVQN